MFIIKKILDKLKELGDYTGFFLLLLCFVIMTLIASNIKETGNNSNNLGAVNDIYTPYKLEGFGKGWYTQPEYDGSDMPINALVSSNNIDFDVKNSIAPRQGTLILGTEATSSYPITSLHTARNLQGIELLIRSYNTVLEYYNPAQSDWETLDTGYTASQRFTFAEGNNSSENQVYSYFANGIEPIKRFRVAYGSISTNDATTITLNAVTGYSGPADIGFKPTGGTLMINGATTTYTGLSGWQLTGLTGLPAYSANEGVISAVETSGFVSAPTSSISIVIKQQRLYAAYKNLVYASKIDNLQDFSYSAPRVANEGEIVYFPDEGGSITGLGIKQSSVVVFKNNYIGSLEFKNFSTDLSDIPEVRTLITGNNVGATNPNAVANFNYQIFYSTNDIGPAIITNVDNTTIDNTAQLAEIIRPSLQEYNYDNSATLYNDFTLYTSAQGPDASFNDRIIIYDSQYKRFTEWNNLNANAFAVYAGHVYYGDAINNNVYQLYSPTYDDNGNDYTTNFKTKWYNFDEPTKWKELGYVFVEGFINEVTSLKFRINLDEGGSLSTKEINIIGTGAYVSAATIGGYGTNPFGLSNFSNIAGSDSNLKHFVGFINTSDITNKKFRNIQFEGETSGVAQNYRITKIIPYYHLLDESYGRSYPNYIIK